MQKNIYKIMCFIIAISMIATSCITVFAYNEVRFEDVELSENVPVNISANYFEKGNNTYDLIFSSLDVLENLKDFNFTITFQNVAITNPQFSPTLKTGSYRVSLVGDNSAEFTHGSELTLVSGKLALCTIECNGLPAKDDISITGFTATDEENNQVTFEPSLVLEEGPVVPELDEEEQNVYDMIVALPQVSSLSFYIEDGSLIDIEKLSKQVSSAVSAYNKLSVSKQEEVKEVLEYNLKSIAPLTELPPVIEAMENVFGVIRLANIVSGLPEAKLTGYIFLLNIYDKYKDIYSPEGLPIGTDVSNQYILADNLLKQSKTSADLAYSKLEYSDKVDCITAQYNNSLKLSNDIYYKDYLNNIIDQAKALSVDIEKNYTGKYKDYMLDELKGVIEKIQAILLNIKSLPTFTVSEIKRGYNFTVTVTRSTMIVVDSTVTVEVSKADAPYEVLDTKTVDFSNGAREVEVRIIASTSRYPSEKYLNINVKYQIDDAVFDLGTEKVLCGKHVGNASGSGSSSNIPSGKNDDNDDNDNPSGGTVFPTVKPSDKDDKKDDDKEKEIFTDLKGYEWAKEAIEGLYFAGIINGMDENTFNPSGNVTREQFCKMVVQLFGVLEYDTETSFKDVDKNAWYAPYIVSAIKAGYVQGQSNEYFGVGESIMRQDMATILYRAIGTQNSSAILDFIDKDSIAQYAYDAISELVGLGIMNGYEDNTFKPRGTATRAEAAKTIWGIYQLIND